MGSRGSDFDVSNTIKTSIRNSEPEDNLVMLFKNTDVTASGKFENSEPEVGFNGYAEATNTDEMFVAVPYEHYFINGQDYYRIEYKGKEYLFSDKNWDKNIDKFLADNFPDGGKGMEPMGDDFESVDDAMSHAQKLADDEYEELVSDKWNSYNY